MCIIFDIFHPPIYLSSTPFMFLLIHSGALPSFHLIPHTPSIHRLQHHAVLHLLPLNSGFLVFCLYSVVGVRVHAYTSATLVSTPKSFPVLLSVVCRYLNVRVQTYKVNNGSRYVMRSSRFLEEVWNSRSAREIGGTIYGGTWERA
ncbi:hypothetical protein BDM02DRAFT_2677722 [Thelephora ganbajun]|uniref:Uncharacterized protein n=1 Tax=Thelephora ganbajun TaxID=370292 RepID=A0ACB6ZCV4_THEGA|nr:hypothetical protein BDM02DRAFT_2677722 [Thelephora ganbajun]